MTGLIGFSSGYKAMLECDTLVMLGTDFPYRQFYPTDAKIVQVDIRPENLGRRAPLDLAIVGRREVYALAAILPILKERTDDGHLKDCLSAYKKARGGLDDLATASVVGRFIRSMSPASLLHATEDAVFTFDVGTPTIWAARYPKMNGKRRLIGSLVHGSMANALPSDRRSSSLQKPPDYQHVGRWRLRDVMGDFRRSFNRICR